MPKDMRTVKSNHYDVPSSAGFTAIATCCLWNATSIISKTLRFVKPKIPFSGFHRRFPEIAIGRQAGELLFRSPHRFSAGQGEASQEYFVYFKRLQHRPAGNMPES